MKGNEKSRIKSLLQTETGAANSAPDSGNAERALIEAAEIQRVAEIEKGALDGRERLLVEVAALTQALKKMGHDPAKDFNDRLIAHMSQHPPAPAKVNRLEPSREK